MSLSKHTISFFFLGSTIDELPKCPFDGIEFFIVTLKPTHFRMIGIQS